RWCGFATRRSVVRAAQQPAAAPAPGRLPPPPYAARAGGVAWPRPGLGGAEAPGPDEGLLRALVGVPVTPHGLALLPFDPDDVEAAYLAGPARIALLEVVHRLVHSVEVVPGHAANAQVDRGIAFEDLMDLETSLPGRTAEFSANARHSRSGHMIGGARTAGNHPREGSGFRGCGPVVIQR